MGIINILDTQTANMIAAGEVVEKPASAVKEMIENSIDAGATHIVCEIKGGGNSYIKITDNGKGMSEDDLPKAILPHATSKIKTADDLDGVLTLGFRGEALAAISSVSRLEILSKQKNQPIGHKLTSDENGVEISEEGSPDGTMITVKDLFYNVPARRKFMRKDSSEASAISGVLIKAALSHPEVSFKFVSEGATKFITPGDGDLYSAVYSALGKEFATTLTSVTGIFGDITVGGYISKVGESRGSRSGQYFFVNGRPVQSTQIMAALEQAFRSYMPQKRFPAAVLKLNVPPKSVDVNVHPAKTEIKFADDRKIFEAVYSSVIAVLRNEEQNVVFEEKRENTNIIEPPKKPTPLVYEAYADRRPVSSSIFAADPNFSSKSGLERREKKEETEISLPLNDKIKKEAEEFSKDTKVFFDYSPKEREETPKEQENSVMFSQELQKTQESSATVYQELQKTQENSVMLSQELKKEQGTPQESSVTQLSAQYTEAEEKPFFKVIGEAFGGYIIIELEKALWLVDKHAAHERIIYEELVSKKTSASSQYLLSSHIILLGTEATDMLLENKDILFSYGFEIDSFGDDSVAVRAVPSTLAGLNGVEQILDSFASTLAHGDRLTFDKRCDRALYTVACKAAIKLGPPSDIKELEVLAEKLINDYKLRLCPHGRPIVKEISKREIEKFFDR